MEPWHLSIASWVIQDGNYPDFTKGQRDEFAVEFNAPEDLARRPGGGRRAKHESAGWYSIEATVAAVAKNAWVLTADFSCEHRRFIAQHPDALTEGYTNTSQHTRDANRRWVCPQCFDDFADEFQVAQRPGLRPNRPAAGYASELNGRALVELALKRSSDQRGGPRFGHRAALDSGAPGRC